MAKDNCINFLNNLEEKGLLDKNASDALKKRAINGDFAKMSPESVEIVLKDIINSSYTKVLNEMADLRVMSTFDNKLANVKSENELIAMSSEISGAMGLGGGINESSSMMQQVFDAGVSIKNRLFDSIEKLGPGHKKLFDKISGDAKANRELGRALFFGNKYEGDVRYREIAGVIKSHFEFQIKVRNRRVGMPVGFIDNYVGRLVHNPEILASLGEDQTIALWKKTFNLTAEDSALREIYNEMIDFSENFASSNKYYSRKFTPRDFKSLDSYMSKMGNNDYYVNTLNSLSKLASKYVLFNNYGSQTFNNIQNMIGKIKVEASKKGYKKALKSVGSARMKGVVQTAERQLGPVDPIFANSTLSGVQNFTQKAVSNYLLTRSPFTEYATHAFNAPLISRALDEGLINNFLALAKAAISPITGITGKKHGMTHNELTTILEIATPINHAGLGSVINVLGDKEVSNLGVEGAWNKIARMPNRAIDWTSRAFFKQSLLNYTTQLNRNSSASMAAASVKNHLHLGFDKLPPSFGSMIESYGVGPREWALFQKAGKIAGDSPILKPFDIEKINEDAFFVTSSVGKYKHYLNNFSNIGSPLAGITNTTDGGYGVSGFLTSTVLKFTDTQHAAYTNFHKLVNLLSGQSLPYGNSIFKDGATDFAKKFTSVKGFSYFASASMLSILAFYVRNGLSDIVIKGKDFDEAFSIENLKKAAVMSDLLNPVTSSLVQSAYYAGGMNKRFYDGLFDIPLAGTVSRIGGSATKSAGALAYESSKLLGVNNTFWTAKAYQEFVGKQILGLQFNDNGTILKGKENDWGGL